MVSVTLSVLSQLSPHILHCIKESTLGQVLEPFQLLVHQVCLQCLLGSGLPEMQSIKKMGLTEISTGNGETLLFKALITVIPMKSQMTAL